MALFPTFRVCVVITTGLFLDVPSVAADPQSLTEFCRDTESRILRLMQERVKELEQNILKSGKPVAPRADGLLSLVADQEWNRWNCAVILYGGRGIQR